MSQNYPQAVKLLVECAKFKISKSCEINDQVTNVYLDIYPIPRSMKSVLEENDVPSISWEGVPAENRAFLQPAYFPWIGFEAMTVSLSQRPQEKRPYSEENVSRKNRPLGP